MENPNVYRHNILAEYQYVDMFNQCRPSSIFTFLQETATGASIKLKLSNYETKKKYHGMWMIAKGEYHLTRPIPFNERIYAETWHRGGKRTIVYRDFDIFAASGERIGYATSVWVLADIDTFQLMRLDDLAEFRGTDGGDRCRDIMLPRMAMPKTYSDQQKRQLYYSEADLNRHINNTRYADYAADALKLHELDRSKFISGMRIDFISQCRPGETLNLSSTWVDDSGYVDGRSENNERRFSARIDISKRPD